MCVCFLLLNRKITLTRIHRYVDMRPFVCSNAEEDLTYDLYGVVDHMGSLGGGHYTATCLSSPSDALSEDEEKGRWYNFNDRHVHAVYPDRIVSRNAYLYSSIAEENRVHIS